MKRWRRQGSSPSSSTRRFRRCRLPMPRRRFWVAAPRGACARALRRGQRRRSRSRAGRGREGCGCSGMPPGRLAAAGRGSPRSLTRRSRRRWPATTTTMAGRTCSCCRRSGGRLLHQHANSGWEDVTASVRLPSIRPSATAAWADVDHDGDLDIVTGAPQLVRNNGNGSFADATDAARLERCARSRRDRADRLRQPARPRPACSCRPTARRRCSATSATAPSATWPGRSACPGASDTARRPPATSTRTASPISSSHDQEARVASR